MSKFWHHNGFGLQRKLSVGILWRFFTYGTGYHIFWFLRWNEYGTQIRYLESARDRLNSNEIRFRIQGQIVQSGSGTMVNMLSMSLYTIVFVSPLPYFAYGMSMCSVQSDILTRVLIIDMVISKRSFGNFILWTNLQYSHTCLPT